MGLMVMWLQNSLGLLLAAELTWAVDELMMGVHSGACKAKSHRRLGHRPTKVLQL
jgi:hypothetical protein